MFCVCLLSITAQLLMLEMIYLMISDLKSCDTKSAVVCQVDDEQIA